MKSDSNGYLKFHPSMKDYYSSNQKDRICYDLTNDEIKSYQNY